MMTNSFRLDQIFRDQDGNIVIAQPPNLALSTWMGASLLQFLFSEGATKTALEIIALVAIVIWALQELFDGVNYFRRGLGLVVLLTICISKIDAIFTF